MPTSHIVQVTPGSALTPFRTTSLDLDLPETVVTEDGVRVYRTGSDIAARAAAGVANASEWQNMRFWSSGCWTISPLQYDIANIQESTVAETFVIGAAEWNFAQITGPSGNQSLFTESPQWAQSDLTGSAYGGDVPSYGDYFLKKVVPAGASCAPNAGFDTGYPLVAYPSADIPMDRVAVSQLFYRANQGFFIRWNVPASINVYTRYLFTFYFGQYALVAGTVFMYLFEYCQPAGGGTTRWVQRTRFQQGAQGAMPGTAHCMGIFPHRHPSGQNYIAFTDIALDKSPQVNNQTTLTSKTAINGEFIYTVDQTVRGGDIDSAPGFVTSANNIRLDMRRELRMLIQVSQLAFYTTGTLYDDDTMVGGMSFTGNTNEVTSYILTSNLTLDYTIFSQVIDGNTQLPFVAGTDYFPEAKFDFAGDFTDTPVLWGYLLKQKSTITTATPGTFTVHGQHYNVDCAAGDPQTEAASINGIVDLTSYYFRLQARERFFANLWTTFNPSNGGNSVNVSLCRGVTTAVRSVRRGSGRTSPTNIDPAWRKYDITMAGMWDKLKEWVQPTAYRVYAVDPVAGPNEILPWKVTDAIVDLLGACGFAPSQVNIPDLPNRFWYGQSSKLEDVTVNPTQNLAEYLVRICRDYLGAYLHFEANAGAVGQWILIFGTQRNGLNAYNPVYHFQASPHTKFSPPSNIGAYPANTTFYCESPEYSQHRPDANMIVVYALVPATNASGLVACHQSAINPLSFAVPGCTTTPNPDHPDYLGYCKKIEIIADYLYVPGPDNTATQAAVDWVTRRLYDFLCHGQLIVKIKAPLVFINDPALAGSASAGWRPLRFQDPVSLDGEATWLIKSVNIDYSNDRIQMATYELIQPSIGQYFFGFELKEIIRRLRRQGVIQTAGSSSHSAAHAVNAPSSHRELGRLEAPKIRHGWASIQNQDGSFIPMDGWFADTGATG